MVCHVSIAFVESDGRKTWTTKRNCRPLVETLEDAKNWAVEEARRISNSQSGVTGIVLTAEHKRTLANYAHPAKNVRLAIHLA